MTRDEKQQAAWWLRTDGSTFRVVAGLLGVGLATVYRWENPEAARADNARRGPAKREWARQYDRKRCPCGTLKGEGSRHRSGELCFACRHEVLAVGLAMREERIAEMYLSGMPLLDMCAKLEIALGNLSARLSEMREKGWDLPYRYAGCAERTT